MTTHDEGSPSGSGGSAGTYVPPPIPPPPPPPYTPPPAQHAGGFPPGEVGTVKIFFIVSLIVNAIATLAWLFSVMGFGIATCGLGCLLIVLPAVTCAATVFDAMAVSKMGQAPTAGVYSFLKTAAIMDIVSGVIGMSVVPVVMGILALVFLQKPEVQRYYGGQ